MKRIFLLVLFLLAGTFIYAQTGTIKIVVTNLENTNGFVHALLYNEANKNCFLKEEKLATQHKIVKINDKKSIVTFENVSYGVYAVSIFHDENSNGKVDLSFIGIPSEAVGISGNKFVIGQPKFDDGKFVLNSEEKTILIKLKSIF